MKATINIDSHLLRTAAEFTGVTGRTALVRLALETLIELEAGKRLIALGGSDPKAKAGRRRKSVKSR